MLHKEIEISTSVFKLQNSYRISQSIKLLCAYHYARTNFNSIQFNFKINVILSGLEKYMIFSLDNKLVFIDGFQFLSSSLDSLAKNLGKNYFKDLS